MDEPSEMVCPQLCGHGANAPFVAAQMNAGRALRQKESIVVDALGREWNCRVLHQRQV